MLTKEKNTLLTETGPGTPAGELLRRYWYPVAVIQELNPKTATKFVRLLGEDLVLFKDKSGRVGLLGDHCPHRSASLLYGRVEERGIACAYHGWLVDTDGNILETPPERNDAIMRNIKHRAYRVQKFVGMYWAYLGPDPAPLIPGVDVWVRHDGTQRIMVHPQIDANWFQATENSMDPAHAQVLHQTTLIKDARPANTTRGYTDDVRIFEFSTMDLGFWKRRTYANGFVEEHPLIFPNILRVGRSTEIRVPIDDTHTVIYEVFFTPTADGSLVEEGEELQVEFPDPYKVPAGALHPFTIMKMNTTPQQDHAMWETQGPVVDRSKEHLSYSDRGVVLLRRVMFDNIEKVQGGLDPIGVIRDSARAAFVDTNLSHSLHHRTPNGIATPLVPLES